MPDWKDRRITYVVTYVLICKPCFYITTNQYDITKPAIVSLFITSFLNVVHISISSRVLWDVWKIALKMLYKKIINRNYFDGILVLCFVFHHHVIIFLSCHSLVSPFPKTLRSHKHCFVCKYKGRQYLLSQKLSPFCLEWFY